MKAFGYIRCSGLGQMDGDGPVRQRKAILDFANANGHEVVEWFVESHTGTDLEGRPEFQKMLLALVSSGVRMVIVEKLDRAARDIMIQETIFADFRKNAVELLSATPGEHDLCSTDPTRTMIRQILGCFFEYERKMIVLKTRAARERIRATGAKCEGRKEYGARPGELSTLQRIWKLATAGCQPREIAEVLNDSSTPTRYDKRWHASTISKILARQKALADLTQKAS